MTNRERYRHRPQPILTVGDGFRIGIGIAFWLCLFTVGGYALVFVLMIGAGAFGGG